MFHPCFPESVRRDRVSRGRTSLRQTLAQLLLGWFLSASLLVSAEFRSSSTEVVSPLERKDVASLTAELHRISNRLGNGASSADLASLRESLPEAWTVATPDGAYRISTDPLRSQLGGGATENAKVWVDHLAAVLDGYTAPGAPLRTDSRTKLESILSRPEFHSVHPPTAWDRFREQLVAEAQRLLLRLLGAISRSPIGGTALFWLTLCAAVGVIGLWVFRFLTGRDQLESLPAAPVPFAMRTWQEWLGSAREAASRSDYREAVHAAYWAGISRLEDVGALPRDLTKTPREFVRLLTDLKPQEAGRQAAYREPLSLLTARAEQVWYGNQCAHKDDFHDALRQLEALGCQLE